MIYDGVLTEREKALGCVVSDIHINYIQASSDHSEVIRETKDKGWIKEKQYPIKKEGGRSGHFTYQIAVPVTVYYSQREDGSVSVDAVAAPCGSEINNIIDSHAAGIKRAAEWRC